jgi:hypothetical protein
MKKTLAIIGGIVAAASIFTVIVVILKKIRLSFTIESADDNFELEEDNGDISVSIDEDDSSEEEAAAV